GAEAADAERVTAAARAGAARAEAAGAARVTHGGAAQAAEGLVDARAEATRPEDVRDGAFGPLEAEGREGVHGELAVLFALVLVDLRRALLGGELVLLGLVLLAELA